MVFRQKLYKHAEILSHTSKCLFKGVLTLYTHYILIIDVSNNSVLCHNDVQHTHRCDSTVLSLLRCQTNLQLSLFVLLAVSWETGLAKSGSRCLLQITTVWAQGRGSTTGTWSDDRDMGWQQGHRGTMWTWSNDRDAGRRQGRVSHLRSTAGGKTDYSTH